ncbi:sarcosine oxidase subunit gamma [Kineococcus gynurae]|uniref:Sarcosine oxidase subunit gamma n=1 Tax=Kineococcus gynurae TaxID=452979 RepID=A0ABV5LS02_9ACTN
MAELLLTPTHPLDGRDLPAETAGIVALEPLAATVAVRAEGAAADAAAAFLGTTLPGPGSFSRTADGVVVWLGPDEFLVTSAGSGPDLERRLRETLRPHGGSAVDQSANRVGLSLTGPMVRDLLAGGCSIDLHPRSFPPGSAVRTTLALAEVVLLAGDSGFTVLVRSSFAGYLADWFADAALEYV